MEILEERLVVILFCYAKSVFNIKYIFVSKWLMNYVKVGLFLSKSLNMTQLKL